MANQEYAHPELGGVIRKILLTVSVIILPCIQWSIFGWLHIVFPLLSFFMLSKYGLQVGRRLLVTAVVISFVVYIGLNSADLFIFSIALLFTGYILFKSTERHDTPAMSGFKAFIVLAGCWFIVLNILSVEPGLSAYGQLIKALDEGIIETLKYYRESSKFEAETLLMLETTLMQMRALVPIIMPAILASFVLFIIWFTMVVGNILVSQMCGKVAWASYRFWQLPDKLIWLVICMGVVVLIPHPLLRLLSINSLILLAIIYCFQGLAINVFFMNKWNVPLLLRSFIYVMIIFQSLGTLLLLVFGIADIWFDFRKLRISTEKTGE